MLKLLLPVLLLIFVLLQPIDTAPKLLTDMVATSGEFEKFEPCLPGLLVVKCDKAYVRVKHPRYGVQVARIQQSRRSRKIVQAGTKVRVWVNIHNPTEGLLVDQLTSKPTGTIEQPLSYSFQLMFLISLSALLLWGVLRRLYRRR